MLQSNCAVASARKVTCSHLDEFIGQTEPCLARGRCGPSRKRAQMWAESHHCQCTVDSFDRPSSLSSSMLDFPVTYIDHALASALLLRSSSPQVGDSVVQLHRLREEKRWSTMKRTSARQTSFGSRYSFRTLRALIVMLVYLGCLVAPSLSHGAELRQELWSIGTRTSMLPVHRWPPKHPFSGSTRSPSAFSVSVMVRFWSRPSGRKTQNRWTQG